MSKIKEWALAIQEFEGFFTPSWRNWRGSISWRQNNPGNLRWSPFQLGTRDGFAYFKDYQAGFDALCYQLRLAALGKSRVYKSTDTLAVFFSRYAPTEDSNNPDVYAKFVAKKLGVPVSTKISTLL